MDENDNEESLKSNIRKRSIKSVVLLSILFVYLIFGAVVFAFLENETRKSRIEAAAEELEEERSELLKVNPTDDFSFLVFSTTHVTSDLFRKSTSYFFKSTANPLATNLSHLLLKSFSIYEI